MPCLASRHPRRCGLWHVWPSMSPRSSDFHEAAPISRQDRTSAPKCLQGKLPAALPQNPPPIPTPHLPAASPPMRRALRAGSAPSPARRPAAPARNPHHPRPCRHARRRQKRGPAFPPYCRAAIRTTQNGARLTPACQKRKLLPSAPGPRTSRNARHCRKFQFDHPPNSVYVPKKATGNASVRGIRLVPGPGNGQGDGQ